MASLIDEAARIRAEAERCRLLSFTLRIEARRQTGELHAQRLRMVRSYDCARQIRAGGLPTAWSSLRWSEPGHDLETVLEPVSETVSRRSRETVSGS